MGARQRRQQLLEQELKEQKRVLEIARRSNIYSEATVREQVRILTVQLEEVRGQQQASLPMSPSARAAPIQSWAILEDFIAIPILWGQNCRELVNY